MENITEIPTQGIQNIGVPQVANRAIIPLVFQSGIAEMVVDLVPIAVDKVTLLMMITRELEKAFAGLPPHPALDMNVFAEVLNYIEPGQVYSAINMDVLDRVLETISDNPLSPVMLASRLPGITLTPGPAEVFAGRDPNDPSIVRVTFTEPPTVQLPDGSFYTWEYELYIGLKFIKRGSVEGSDEGYVHEQIAPVPETGQQMFVRVLYVTQDGELTPFGPPAVFL